MADKIEQLIKHLRRIESNTKIKAADDITDQVAKHFPDSIKLVDKALVKDFLNFDKNRLRLITANFQVQNGAITTSKGRIHL